MPADGKLVNALQAGQLGAQGLGQVAGEMPR